MKTISKLLSIVLALSMVLALCVAASAETTEVKICDFENAEADFSAFHKNTKTDRNWPTTSVTTAGYKGSKGLKYELSALGGENGDTLKGRTHTANHYYDHKNNNQEYLEALGVNVKAAPNNKTDILWFWMDYNVSTTATVSLAFNGKVMMSPDPDTGDSPVIYTLKAKADGTNEIVEIAFDTDVNTHGVSLVAYTPGHEQAYLLFKPGFEGWVGLPNDWIGDGAAFSNSTAGTCNAGSDFPTDVTLQLFQLILLIQNHNVTNHGSVIEDQKVGDHFVIDEMTFTAKGAYPAAADSVVSGGDTTDEPSKTADPAALVAATMVAVASAAGLVVVLKKKEF